MEDKSPVRYSLVNLVCGAAGFKVSSAKAFAKNKNIKKRGNLKGIQ